MKYYNIHQPSFQGMPVLRCLYRFGTIQKHHFFLNQKNNINIAKFLGYIETGRVPSSA